MAENYYDLDYTGSMVDRILDTGYDLQNHGYIFRGLASHYTGTPTERTWLIAPTGSTGFGLSSPVPPGSIGICMYNGSSWYAEVLNTLTLDTAPTTGSGNGITSGAVKTLAESITNAIGLLEQSVSDRFTSLTLEDTTGSLQAELLSITMKYVFEGETESLTSISILAATAEKAGLMSATDKQKLDAFITNIRSLRIQDTTAQDDQGSEITNTLKWTIGGVTEAITAFTLYAATTSKAGLMSAADKTALDTLPSLINAGYLYAGIATPSTVPSSTSAKIFYLAIEGGTYTGFNLNVTQGINIIYKSGDAWSVAQVVGIDNEPTAGSDNLVKSGGVKTELALGAVYDVSAHNNGATFESLSALLSDTDLNALIPTAVRKGGMSIKFVQSSDNNYVQFRLKSQTFSINKEDWEEEEQVVYSGSDGDDSLSFVDSNGNCNLQIKGGHVKTKEFDSRDSATKTYVGTKISTDIGAAKTEVLSKVAEVDNIEQSDSELAFVDEEGNCNLLIRDGHIKTKNFNSENTQKQKSFLSLSNSDLTVSGSSQKNIDGTITLASGVANKAYINSTMQNWHYTMLAKFRCTGEVSFVMGKDRADYGAKIEVVKDGNGSYVKLYSTVYVQNSYVVGLKHTATLDFTLNEGEDYTLIIKSDVSTNKIWNIELIGEFNEYFTESSDDLDIPNINGYGRPYLYTDATSCLLKEYAFTINRYYDVKNSKIAVFGHSMVEADSLGSERQKCFANLLAEYVGETKCPNFGLGGLTASQLIGMLGNCLPLTRYIQYGIILIGGNDGGQTTETLISELQQMCGLMESYEITPILCTEHPWSEGNDPNNPSQKLPPIFRSNITAMNAWIRDSGYLYCDMEQIFVDVDIVNGNPTNSNIRTDLYLTDMTHPTVEGHKYMFNRLMMDCPYLF